MWRKTCTYHKFPVLIPVQRNICPLFISSPAFAFVMIEWVNLKLAEFICLKISFFFYTTLFWRFQECAEAFASVEGRSNPVCNEFVNSWFINKLLNIWEEILYIYIHPIYLFISYLYIHIKIWYTSLSSHIFNSLLIEIQRSVQQCKWPKVILR